MLNLIYFIGFSAMLCGNIVYVKRVVIHAHTFAIESFGLLVK